MRGCSPFLLQTEGHSCSKQPWLSAQGCHRDRAAVWRPPQLGGALGCLLQVRSPCSCSQNLRSLCLQRSGWERREAALRLGLCGWHSCAGAGGSVCTQAFSGPDPGGQQPQVSQLVTDLGLFSLPG